MMRPSGIAYPHGLQPQAESPPRQIEGRPIPFAEELYRPRARALLEIVDALGLVGIGAAEVVALHPKRPALLDQRPKQRVRGVVLARLLGGGGEQVPGLVA